MSDTIRWCFTHQSTTWNIGDDECLLVNEWGVEGDCDIADALVIRAPIDYEADQPMLGLATTRQLIEELTVRIEMDGMLDYRTVDAALGGQDD